MKNAQIAFDLRRPAVVQRQPLTTVIATDILQLELGGTLNARFLIIFGLGETPDIRQLCLAWVRRVTPLVPKGRVVSSVRKPGNAHSQRATDCHIVHIVPVVLAARNGDHDGGEQRGERKQHTTEIRTRPEDMALASKEQREVTEAREGETRMARGEGPPSVVQSVMVGFGADFEGDELVCGGSFLLR